jgi:hypothetical protein
VVDYPGLSYGIPLGFSRDGAFLLFGNGFVAKQKAIEGVMGSWCAANPC